MQGKRHLLLLNNVLIISQQNDKLLHKNDGLMLVRNLGQNIIVIALIFPGFLLTFFSTDSSSR